MASTGIVCIYLAHIISLTLISALGLDAAGVETNKKGQVVVDMHTYKAGGADCLFILHRYTFALIPQPSTLNPKP